MIPMKPKSSEDDPMKVIDSDKGEEASASEEEAPAKPKRRTYRKKAEASDDTSGVMSTLSRGRADDSDDEEKDKRPANAAE